MGCIDVRMVPLKVLLFCFFGAMGCLFPFLPLHMRSAGLSAEEARIVSMVAPAASLLGPLAVGPLADRLASGLWGHSGSKESSDKGGLKDYAGRTKGHRRLRALLATLMFLSAVAYCLMLLVVPIVTRRDARTPQVSFRCDSAGGKSGGVIVQERCADQCHDWGGERVGSLVLTDCRYECEEEDEVPESSLLGSVTEMTTEEEPTTTQPPPIIPFGPVEGTFENEDEDEITDDYDTGTESTTEGDEGGAENLKATTSRPIAAASHGHPSHLCFAGESEDHKTPGACHAFYTPKNGLAINATLDGSLIGGQEGLCIYPLSSFNIRGKEYPHLTCHPPALGRCRVTCSIDQPYNEVNFGPSLLGPSGSCPSMLGDPRLTFWSYLIVRSVADCFPAAAITILDATLLLPSSTSPGKQVAAGALGIAIASPVVAGLLAWQQEEWTEGSPHILQYLPYPWPPFAVFSLLALFTVILLMVFPIPVLLGEESRKPRKAHKLANCEARPAEPSPVLYPRRPRPRLGPYPPTRLSTHACEAVALFIVLMLLGMFWGGLDSYTSWYMSDLMGVNGEESVHNMSVVQNETIEDYGLNDWLPPSPPPLLLLLLLGLIMTAAALPAIPLMWYAEKIVEICGHANLLIIAFTFYIVRYAVLSFIDDGWWALISEAVAAPVSMGLAWATAVHYTHLLCPPRLSATAQAVAVAAHFCIGRCLGSIIGGFTWAEFGLKMFLQGGALAAAVVATIYFLIYHCCLKARCVGGTGGLRPGGSGGIAWGAGGRGYNPGVDGPTTNGNYTPLRVYHNGKGDERKDRY